MIGVRCVVPGPSGLHACEDESLIRRKPETPIWIGSPFPKDYAGQTRVVGGRQDGLDADPGQRKAFLVPDRDDSFFGEAGGRQQPCAEHGTTHLSSPRLIIVKKSG